MGWLFTEQQDKATFIKDILHPAPGVELLDKAVYGNEVYALYHSLATGNKTIVVLLLKKDKDGWGYKDMDESMGPYYHNCPVRLLNASNCMSETAIKWRDTCRQKAAEKAKVKASVRVGYRFEWAGVAYTLVEIRDRGFRRGKAYIGQSDSGAVYRFQPKHMKKAV